MDYRHRGLDDTNETEVARLVEERLRPARRPRCRVTERLPGGNGSRFRCAAGTQRYAVTWEHYGSGRYIIAARGTDGSTQELARGVLTISE